MTRSLITLALLSALGHWDEVRMHVRATANTGATSEEVREAMLHVAIYAGAPAANHALKIVRDTLSRNGSGHMSIPNRRPPAGGFFARDRGWQPAALTPRYRSSVVRSPGRALVSMPQTLTETTGPVFGHGLLGPLDNDLTVNYAAQGESAVGPRIVVFGRLVDETGRGVPGALIEIWQANAGGRYRHPNERYIAPLDPNFGGCGRTVTAEDGSYEFRTIQPGPYPWPNGGNDWRPAHIHFSLFGSGFAQRLITQMYFGGDPMIALCPIVGTIPDPAGIDSLTARLDMGSTIPMDARAYRFDLVLRGRRQTVFENRPEGT